MNEHWTEERLATLTVNSGVRQRGVDMTRLETFCDAAFAFAVTLLVIGERIPVSYEDLILALKGVPAFAASFAAIASFWWAHRTWSRSYGLEDGVTTLISLAMVFIMLVYVYPLKMVFSGFAFYASGGFFPSGIAIKSGFDMLGVFVIYGVGFTLQTGMLALLYVRVLVMRRQLGLNAVERIRAWQGIVMNLILGATGVLSALWALAMPSSVSMYAGFCYMTLPVTMPLAAVWFGRLATRAAPNT